MLSPVFSNVGLRCWIWYKNCILYFFICTSLDFLNHSSIFSVGFFYRFFWQRQIALVFSKKMDYFAFSLNFMRPIQIMVVQIHHIKNSDGLIYLDKILLSLSFNSVEILLNLYQTTRNSLPSTKWFEFLFFSGKLKFNFVQVLNSTLNTQSLEKSNLFRSSSVKLEIYSNHYLVIQQQFKIACCKICKMKWVHFSSVW